ncbi:fatty acid desaturase family protein [Arenimonas soli]|nr:fatty acid desaturase [Arenimonas soli]
MKPKIPARFTRTDSWAGIWYLLHGCVLWFGSGFSAYALWQLEAWPPVLRLPLIALATVGAAAGMFFLGSLGHEGFHGNLHRQRDVSMLMGIVGSLGAPLFLSTGVNLGHWRHHSHTNTERDPDFVLYRGNRSLLARLRVPLSTSAQSLRNVAGLLVGNVPMDSAIPFSRRRMQGYVLLNIVLVGASTTAFAVLAFKDPVLFACLVAAPALVAQAYWSLHPYIEHGGTGTQAHLAARNCTSPVYRVLLLGYTWHLCHHLYPRVQTHKLPALARHLREVGYFGDDVVDEPRLLGALRTGMTRALSA